MNWPALIVIVLFTLQCSPYLVGGQIVGEWQFADIRNAGFLTDAMTPPMFDTLSFRPDGSIDLTNSLMGREFEGTYEASQTDITWTFQPADVQRPIEHRVYYKWSVDGGLVLRSAQARDSSENQVEWVFFRSDSFLPNHEVVGTWQRVAENGEVGATRSLLANGKTGEDSDSPWGQYCLWKSGSTTMMTTLLWVPGHGAFATFEAVEVQEDRLVLTGRSPPGIPQEPPRTWLRVAETGASD